MRLLATIELTERGYSLDVTMLNSSQQIGTRPKQHRRKSCCRQPRPHLDPDSPQVQRRPSPYKNMPSLTHL